MKKVTIIVEITVDEENIKDLYPNFSINWDNADEFIENLTEDMQTKVDFNGMQIDHLKVYGYSKRVLTRDEAKLIDIDNY